MPSHLKLTLLDLSPPHFENETEEKFHSLTVETSLSLILVREEDGA